MVAGALESMSWLSVDAPELPVFFLPNFHGSGLAENKESVVAVKGSAHAEIACQIKHAKTPNLRVGICCSNISKSTVCGRDYQDRRRQQDPRNNRQSALSQNGKCHYSWHN